MDSVIKLQVEITTIIPGGWERLKRSLENVTCNFSLLIYFVLFFIYSINANYLTYKWKLNFIVKIAKRTMNRHHIFFSFISCVALPVWLWCKNILITYIHTNIHTYHSRFTPVGVAETSQIFHRDIHILLKWLSYEKYHQTNDDFKVHLRYEGC
jgi:hypothetical protein